MDNDSALGNGRYVMEPMVLARLLQEALADLGIDNAIVVEGPLPAGWAAQAPYGVILLNGAVDEVPAAIREQLSEGGRLVTVQKSDAGLGRGPGQGQGRGILMQRSGEIATARAIFDAATPILPGFAREAGFVF